MKRKSKVVTLAILLLLIVYVFFYLINCYKASESVNDYLKGDSLVTVKKDENGYLFDGPSEDKILVFYPGGRVESKSYVPLMHNLAKEGIDTLIVRMPFNIAFLKTKDINKIKENYNYNNWYLGGHSLGGVVAARDTINNSIDGLILLASYSIKEVECSTLSIYGSKDGILNLENYNENKKNLKNLKEIIIEGGNHSNFGNYGLQENDNLSTIDKEIQQERTIQEILKFIEETNKNN